MRADDTWNSQGERDYRTRSARTMSRTSIKAGHCFVSNTILEIMLQAQKLGGPMIRYTTVVGLYRSSDIEHFTS